jgi:hypothetical protein
MQYELDALMSNGTWNFVDSPPSIASKLVYRIKRLIDASIERLNRQ